MTSNSDSQDASHRLQSLTWEFQRVSADADVSVSLVAEIYSIFLDGFGTSGGWSRDRIGDWLRENSSLGLLKRRGEEGCYGYATHLVPDCLLDKMSVVFESGICLRKQVQGCGLTSGLIEKVCEHSMGQSFGWLGGRTQNPLVMRRYSKLGKTFPFDSDYNTPEGRDILEFLRTHVPEVRDLEQLDSVTGICRGVYQEGRLGDYSVATIHGTDRFEQQLRDWRFNREAGDAVITFTRLDQPIIADVARRVEYLEARDADRSSRPRRNTD